MPALRPAAELEQFRSSVRGIFTDIDDTLTHAGALVPAAYEALVRAGRAGLRIVPVTGRPAGWAAVLAATWPVDAVVAENGGVAFIRHVVDGRVSLEELWWEPDPTVRAQESTSLASLREQILAAEPTVIVSQDQWLRRTDLAFDIGETHSLPAETVRRLVARIEAAGARSAVSTVHAHASFTGTSDDAPDKARMLVRLLRSCGEDLDGDARNHYVFVGDSPNDQAGFAHFPLSVGVANVRRFVDQLRPAPTYITDGAGGHGFAELVATLLG